MSLKKALMAATVLSLPVAAQAQPISGLYLGAGVGANYRENNSVNPRLSPSGILTGQVGIDTLPIVAGQSATEIASRAITAAKLGGYDVDGLVGDPAEGLLDSLQGGQNQALGGGKGS